MGGSPLPQQSFTVSISPSTSQGSPLMISVGSWGNEINVTVAGQNGFSGTVNLNMTGLPSGVTANPATWTLNSGQSQKVTVTAAANAALGTFQATVSGASGALNFSATLSAKVLVPQISWSRDQLARIMTPGSTATEIVQFRSDSDLTNVNLVLMGGGSCSGALYAKSKFLLERNSANCAVDGWRKNLRR